MKKMIAALLMISTLFLSAACTSLSRNSSDDIIFYYCKNEISFHISDGVIASENRSAREIGNDLLNIVTSYLQGPKTTGLSLLFSPGTSLVEIKEDNDILEIILSTECADMPELDLSCACACLARTLFPYTDAEKIAFSTPEGFSRFEMPLIFTSESILTEDTVIQDN